MRRRTNGDPTRKSIAARRVGIGSKCECGENRPLALIAGSKPMICAACKRRAQGRTTYDHHHPAGDANHRLTVPIPVNDHRAVLSEAHPPGVNPEHFHLIAPFELDSGKWLKMLWIDQYSGEQFRITTEQNGNIRRVARVNTFAGVIAEYAYHPESKYADDHGNPSDRQTIGLLQRRHVGITEIVKIGKESNHLEEVDAGLIHAPDEVYTVYPDQKADHWGRVVRPLLQKIPLSVQIRETGLSRRMLIKARRGYARPHPRNQRVIVDALRRLGSMPHQAVGTQL